MTHKNLLTPSKRKNRVADPAKQCGHETLGSKKKSKTQVNVKQVSFVFVL